MKLRAVLVLFLQAVGASAQVNISGAGSAAYKPTISTAAGLLGNLAVVNTTIVNVTGAGVLNEIRVRITTPVGNPSCTGLIAITVDGGSAVNQLVWDGVTGAWPAALIPLQSYGTGLGTVAGDTFVWTLNQTYSTSLNVTWAGDACGGDSGAVRVTVLRGVRI